MKSGDKVVCVDDSRQLDSQPTDTQLKQTLAKMLPGIVELRWNGHIYWIDGHNKFVQNVELLHLCWLVEESLSAEQWNDYIAYVMADVHSIFTYEHLLHATWQQRVIALAKVKGYNHE